MTETEFDLLDLNRKSHLVWAWGYYITNRKLKEYNTVLFYLEGFFVEACLSLDSSKQDVIKAVSKGEVKAKYDLLPKTNFIHSLSRIPEYLLDVA
jgi:hypothetical protein